MRNKFKNSERMTLIGITTVATLLMFYFGFNFLKGIHIFDKSKMYYMTFMDLQDVERSSKVSLNGYKVGNVRSIDFDYKGLGHAVLTVALDGSLELPEGTAGVIQSNPLGGPYVELLLPKEVQEGIIRPRDTIVGIPSQDMLATLKDELVPNLNRAAISLDSLLGKLHSLASDPMIHQTLGEVQKSASSIRSSSQKVDMMLSKEMPVILDHLDSSAKSIAEMSGKLNQAELDQVVKNLSAVVVDLKGFMTKLNEEEGSLGKLINDPKLYDRLAKTTQSADSLLMDIQANPKKYVHFSLF